MLSNFVVWIVSNSSSKYERVSMGPIYLSRSGADLEQPAILLKQLNPIRVI